VEEVSLIFRPVHRFELERLRPLLVADPASPLAAEQLQIRFDSGEYRPEWSWIAETEPGEDAVALAIWWGTAREKLPAALDGLFVASTAGSQRAAGAEDRVGLAARLLASGHEAFAGLASSVRRTSTCSCCPTGATGRMLLAPSAGGWRRRDGQV
jgi:hypothetical protein